MQKEFSFPLLQPNLFYELGYKENYTRDKEEQGNTEEPRNLNNE